MLLAVVFQWTLAANAEWHSSVNPSMVQMHPGTGLRSPVFYVGKPVYYKLTGSSARRFEVRDYWGRLVKSGPTTVGDLQLGPFPAGWYKVYLYTDSPPAAKSVPGALPARGLTTSVDKVWGTICGGSTFVVFRHNHLFPELAPLSAPSPSYPNHDFWLNGVLGIGLERISVNGKDPDSAIRDLQRDVDIETQAYLPFDRARHRQLLVSFSDGTKDLNMVKRVVSAFKDKVKYWEPRNEPNNVPADKFVNDELKPFYATVKSVASDLKVVGPGLVTVGPPEQPWLEEFFKAGGGNYIDAFSFHAYNNFNGDLQLGRRSMDTLQSMLKKHNLGNIEKWQTEQGYFAAMYGVYQPHHQGRWIMLQNLLLDQYGIPKEHNSYFYDLSHGYWDFPSWLENDDGSLNPTAPLMRVFAEEVLGKTFERPLDFGLTGNKLYFGNVYSDGTNCVAAIMSDGVLDGAVTVAVAPGTKLRVVSAFGAESYLECHDGKAKLQITDLPVYVEFQRHQQLRVEPMNLGSNLCRTPGTTITSSSNPAEKVINGEFENWYWEQKPDTGPWKDLSKKFPAWVEIDFHNRQKISDVIVYAPAPWQGDCAPLSYDLQYFDSGAWRTVASVDEPVRTYKRFTPATQTAVDQFYSERHNFVHSFKPVLTEKVRILAKRASYGACADIDSYKAVGQGGPPTFSLRELEVYGGSP